MKIMSIFLLAMLGTFAAKAQNQKYEYAQIGAGIENSMSLKIKYVFSFGEKYDSAKQYGGFKQLVDALEFAESKGWEVFQFYSSNTGANNAVNTGVYVVLRRPRTKVKPQYK